MKQIRAPLLLPLLCVILSSCGDAPEERALLARWSQENQRLAGALGERVFEKYDDMVFSAIMLAWTHAGLDVTQCGRASGFIIAEGKSPLPADEAAPLCKRRTEEVARLGGRHAKSPPDPGRYRVITTLTRLGKSTTRVSLRLTAAPHDGAGGRSRPPEGYPPIIEAIYKTLWQRLDRQIFVQEHLIHRRYLLGTDPNM